MYKKTTFKSMNLIFFLDSSFFSISYWIYLWVDIFPICIFGFPLAVLVDIWFGDISTFVGYLILKLFLSKNNNGNILPICDVDKSDHTFPKNISPKGIAIEWLELKLVYYDFVVQDVNLYITGMMSRLLLPPYKGSLKAISRLIWWF